MGQSRVVVALRRAKLALVLAAVIWAPASSRAADLLTPEQSEIYDDVLKPQGWLTEAMHRRFWDVLRTRAHGDAQRMEEDMRRVRAMASASLDLQNEVWTSAKLSLAAHAVVKSSGFEQAKAAALASVAEFPRYRISAEQAVSSSEEFLKIVAAGQPLGNGEPMAPEKADTLLAQVAAARHRMARLLAPSWAPMPERYAYPDAHLTISWIDPPTVELLHFEDVDKSVRVVTLSDHVSENESVELQFLPAHRATLIDTDMVRERGDDLLRSLGAAAEAPKGGTWRGHPSLLWRASALGPKGISHLSLRMVTGQEHHGVWIILVRGAATPERADELRRQVESAIVLDR